MRAQVLLPFMLTAASLHYVRGNCTEIMPCNNGRGVCLNGVCRETLDTLVRENLRFKIVVKYPEAELTKNGASQELYLRGNGLGLTPNEGTLMSKNGTDKWELVISYKSSEDGYQCKGHLCKDFSTKQMTNFQYRVYTDDAQDMLGANFVVDLPVSKSSEYFSDVPVYTVFPWFFTTTYNVSKLDVETNSDVLGKVRSFGVVFPPSFTENTYKKHGVIFVIDMLPVHTLVFNKMFRDPIVKHRTMEEHILITFANYTDLDVDRTNLLTPTNGSNFECYNGTYLDGCSGCIPFNRTEASFGDMVKWIYSHPKCGKKTSIGGLGEKFLDFVIRVVFPKVIKLSSNRVLTNRENIGIVGYSLGGLLSCHAAWTRPELFGSAGCMSSSFWWPTGSNSENKFDFLNKTLLNAHLLNDRPPQRIYIDAGSDEDIGFFAMAAAAKRAMQILSKTKGLMLGKNLWLSIYSGQTHSVYAFYIRSWKVMETLYQPKGDPVLQSRHKCQGADNNTTSTAASFDLSLFISLPLFFISVFVKYNFT